jgi:hypothetical protein
LRTSAGRAAYGACTDRGERANEVGVSSRTNRFIGAMIGAIEIYFIVREL